jgi:hypothetical protein
MRVARDAEEPFHAVGRIRRGLFPDHAHNGNPRTELCDPQNERILANEEKSGIRHRKSDIA